MDIDFSSKKSPVDRNTFVSKRLHRKICMFKNPSSKRTGKNVSLQHVQKLYQKLLNYLLQSILIFQFSIDFHLLYPDKSFIEEDKWEKIKTFLISYLDRSCTKCNDDLILIELLKSGDLKSGR